jgi:hypothetical protein
MNSEQDTVSPLPGDHTMVVFLANTGMLQAFDRLMDSDSHLPCPTWVPPSWLLPALGSRSAARLQDSLMTFPASTWMTGVQPGFPIGCMLFKHSMLLAWDPRAGTMKHFVLQPEPYLLLHACRRIQ